MMKQIFFEQIEFIKTLLRKSGFAEVADDILEQQLSGGTGGEVLLMVCARLLGIKERNLEAYRVIEKEADDLIDYCRSIGMYPKATYPDDPAERDVT